MDKEIDNQTASGVMEAQKPHELQDSKFNSSLADKSIICSRCGKERKKYSCGMCKSCYNLIHRDKEKHKEYLKKWYQSHKEYFKEYWKKRKDGSKQSI